MCLDSRICWLSACVGLLVCAQAVHAQPFGAVQKKLWNSTDPEVQFTGSWTAYSGFGGHSGGIKYALVGSGATATMSWTADADDGGLYAVTAFCVEPTGETAAYTRQCRVTITSVYGEEPEAGAAHHPQHAYNTYTGIPFRVSNGATVSIVVSCPSDRERFYFNAIGLYRIGALSTDPNGDGVPDPDLGNPVNGITPAVWLLDEDYLFAVSPAPHLVGAHVLYPREGALYDADSGEVYGIYGHLNSLTLAGGYLTANFFWGAVGSGTSPYFGAATHWTGNLAVTVGRNGHYSITGVEPGLRNGSSSLPGLGFPDGLMIARPLIRKILDDPRGIVSANSSLIPTAVFTANPGAGKYFSVEEVNPAKGAFVRAMLTEMLAGLPEVRDFREVIPRTADQQFDDMGADFGGGESGGGSAPGFEFPEKPVTLTFDRNYLNSPTMPEGVSKFFNWGVPTEVETRNLQHTVYIGIPGSFEFCNYQFDLQGLSDGPFGFQWDQTRDFFRTLMEWVGGGFFVLVVYWRLGRRGS